GCFAAGGDRSWCRRCPWKFSSPSHEGLLRAVGVATAEGCSVVVSALYASLSLFQFSLSLSFRGSKLNVPLRALSLSVTSLINPNFVVYL
ncbi:hypothetical protein S245_051757, partial [Arachis hypogaea]